MSLVLAIRVTQARNVLPIHYAQTIICTWLSRVLHDKGASREGARTRSAAVDEDPPPCSTSAPSATPAFPSATAAAAASMPAISGCSGVDVEPDSWIACWLEACASSDPARLKADFSKEVLRKLRYWWHVQEGLA